MKYTFIKIEEWCGLWRGADDEDAELVYEHHDLDVAQLYDYTKQDGEFELVVYSYPNEGEYASQFDPEQGFGGFSDRTLAEWLPLCGDPR